MSTIAASRIDFAVIAGLVKPGTKVLDVGCGDGDLLDLLQRERGIDGRGIEISQKGVNECVARGLAVIQGDADSDLGFYQDKGFDYVILSQTLQATRNPRIVLEHLLRIGDRAIVSIPNFGHWRVRLSLFWTGRMPVTKLCGEVGATIESAAALNAHGERMGIKLPRFLWNFFGQQAVFMVRK